MTTKKSSAEKTVRDTAEQPAGNIPQKKKSVLSSKAIAVKTVLQSYSIEKVLVQMFTIAGPGSS